MPDLDVEIRDALERLTGPVDSSSSVSFERLAARRRQRRIRRAIVAAVPTLLVFGLAVAGMLFAANDGAPDVAAGIGEPAISTRGAVAVVSTKVVAEDGATTQVVMEFDRPLPDGEVRYLRDLTVVNSPIRGFYTAQGPQGAHVCDGTHFFGPSAIGTVDVLLPSGWFSDEDGAYTSAVERVGEPPKFVACGPHRGFYQYSIWGPASAAPLDVAVTIGPDRLRLTIEINPTSDETTDTSSSSIDDEERSGICASLIRAADASRLQLEELDRAVTSAAKKWAAPKILKRPNHA